MSNPCIKTGANVYFDSHHAIRHCDLFKVDGVYVLHHIGNWVEEGDWYGNHINLRVYSDRYLDLHTAKVVAVEEEKCSRFIYDGVTKEEIEL